MKKMSMRIFPKAFMNLQCGEEQEYDDIHAVILARCLTQYGLKTAINKFGDDAVNASVKEVSQLHNRDVFRPVHWSDLSKDEQKEAIESLIHIKKKRDGSLKGLACADGRPQRATTTKEDASSPTASLDAILLTCVIDAYEEREVATVDIPNAFVQTDLDLRNKDGSKKKVIMKITGKLADILIQTAPELYGSYAVKERGTIVIYVEILKALYGLLLVAVLFYKKLLKDLQAKGFVLNKYDPCVVNKVIRGKQCTIVWWVDNLKVSHKEKEVIDGIIVWLKDKYEDKDIGIMKPTRGKKTRVFRYAFGLRN